MNSSSFKKIKKSGSKSVKNSEDWAECAARTCIDEGIDKLFIEWE